MGGDIVLRSEPPRSVPGQLPTLAQQSWIAICRLANKYVSRSTHMQVHLTTRGSVVGTTGFVLALSWVSQTTAGHTKRVTTNAIMLSAYCIGNAAGPFMWNAKYKPR